MNNHSKCGTKVLSIILTLAAILTAVTFVPNYSVNAATDTTRVIGMRINSPLTFLNGNAAAIDNQGTKPIILKSRTMLPLRFVSEKLGAKVTWTDNKKPIVITLNGKKVSLTIGTKKMTVVKNGKTTTKTLDAPATLHKGRTLVPIRAISEALDFKIHYKKVSGIATVVVSNQSLTTAKRDSAHSNARKLPLSPVKKQTSALVMSQKSAKLKKKGSALQLTAKPQNSNQGTGLTWSSDDKKVATVDVFGVVTAQKDGQAIIKAKSAGGQNAYCVVTVGDYDPNVIPVEKVTLDQKSVTLYVWTSKKEQKRYGAPGDSFGSMAYLYETVTPWYATHPTITWKSGDKKIAIVDREGLVTGKSPGTTTITATSHNGKTATCKVTVKANVRTCTYEESLSKEVFRLINNFRAENGIPKLNSHPDAVGIAYRQAEYNLVEHIPDLAFHGMGQCGVAGNLTEKSKLTEIPKEAVAKWKNSPAHHDAFLDNFNDNETISHTEGGCAVFVSRLNGVPESYVCIFYMDILDPNNPGKLLFSDTPVAKWKP